MGPERCTNLCLPIIERMANDQMFYVRKEAAAAIGNLAVVVDHQVALDRLVSHCRRLLSKRKIYLQVSFS